MSSSPRLTPSCPPLPPHSEVQRERARRSLRYFITWASPELVFPSHLEPAVAALERFETEPFRFAFSVPPRHGKSELLLHFIVWALLRNPKLNTLYASYSADQGEAASDRGLVIADRAGVKLKRRAKATWQTPENRWCHWTGCGGALTGKGYQLVIIDDPVKNRVEAESLVYRERAWEMWQNDMRSRMQPLTIGGMRPSVACVQTRWHPDDLAGRLTDPSYMRRPFPAINIPAIAHEDSDRETALWPAMWPLDALKDIRDDVGAYAWSSLYQGQPRPRGASVFGDPTFFSALPLHFRAAQGLDLAFTEKKTADYSAVVTMLLVRTRDPGTGSVTEHFYVRRVVRRQKQAPDFKRDLRLERERFPQARIRWYASGTEKGVAQFLVKPEHVQGGRPLSGITNLQVRDPSGDKYTRAIGFAAAWNAGRVLVPSPELVAENPSEFDWVGPFLDELRAFTGVKDKRDDQIDAAVAAYDLLATSATELKPMTPEQRAPFKRRM